MFYGNVIFIKKSGHDGSKYPVTRKSVKIGRSNDCVIRIQTPGVSPQHCHLIIDKNGQAKIRNLSKHTPTFLNDVPLGKGDHVMNHGDVIKVGERYARWEYHPSSKYFNPQQSAVEETSSSALQNRNSEGAVAGMPKPKRIDKRRLSEAGSSLGGLGSLGETLKINLGSTKLVARHSLELQKLGLCPQVRIKRCAVVTSPIPTTVTSRNGTPIRTSETWEVKPLTPEQKSMSAQKERTSRKDTPIKKPLRGQPVLRNPSQVSNLDSIPEGSPLSRKTSLERIRLDDVPECTTPPEPTKSSTETLTRPSTKRGMPSKTSIQSGILRTPKEKKTLRSSPRSRSSERKSIISKTQKTPEDQSSKKKLSAAAAAATAERAAEKLKTIKPAKPDKNKKAALLLLGKASSQYKTFPKTDITLKRPGKNKKGVTKQISTKYNYNNKKSKQEKKSSKETAGSLKTESSGKTKKQTTPSGSEKGRASNVFETKKNINKKDITDLSPGKSNLPLKNPVVAFKKISDFGGTSGSSESLTPKKRVGDGILTSPSTSKTKKVSFHGERGSRGSPRRKPDVSARSSLERSESRAPDDSRDWYVTPLVVLDSPRSSPEAGKARESTVERVLRKVTENRPKSQKGDSTKTRGSRRSLTTKKPSKSPKNDLTDVRGVRRLMESPKTHKSPRNDLTDVRGVRRLMRTPREEKPPKNDLTDVEGVSKLFASAEDENKGETGEVVASPVRGRITRMSTRSTRKTMPTETEKESPVVRRSTRRTGTLKVEEKVQDDKKERPRRITAKR